MYEIGAGHGVKIWRDIHSVWQWGITDADLIHTMRGLDFYPVFLKNVGTWGDLSNWECNAFVFKKCNRVVI
jgi:hypothetical protein